jgi:hypothetical protein
MAEKKSLVEETLLQMRSLENVISENAKGILHSTMKEEIGELVKESLKEAEEDESMAMETEMSEQDDDMEVGMPNDSEDETDTKTDDMTDTEDDTEDDETDDMGYMKDDETDDMDDEDEEPIDLTNASDEEILKVFKGMGEEDGIIVKKDGNTVDLQDTNDDAHYKISLGEGFEEEDEDFDFGMSDNMGRMSDEEDEGWEEISPKHHSMDEESEEEDEEVMYEIEMEESEEDESMEEMDESMEEMDESEEESMEEMDESWSDEEDESLEEGFKPKGKGIGKAKFQYKKAKGGFKETMKQGTKGVGMGKPKFEFKKGENMGGTNKVVKKTETKEASRTLGAGRRFGRNGLPKPKAAPRHLNVESVEREVKLLREKNEEYRKALNVFRSKLNEVAVFNSNLAYATRLFTEHSTTKQEKINILRRFDSVESLKESKSLYKIVKDELSSQGGGKIMKESIQEKIEKTPSSGSAANLIESKTYENPQFMRMKDLMSKMNIIK